MDKSSNSEKPDPVFAEAVRTVLGMQFPNLVRAEKYLSLVVLLVTLFTTLGVFTIGGFAAKIYWQREQEEFIKKTVTNFESETSGPVGTLKNSLAAMSTNLSSTFESQVDSAAFKVLRFGCTPPKAQVRVGFPTCSNTLAAAGLLQALDNQTVLLIANPARQLVRLDISLYPVDSPDALQPLLLQVYAEPPPLKATPNSARMLLTIKPDQLKQDQNSNNADAFLQDGRLRLVTTSGVLLQSSIDLTRSLSEQHLRGPIQLRFVIVREVANPSNNAGSPSYEPAAGTELFFIRTLVSAYHRISAD